MKISSPSFRFKKVLVIDDDETDIYISKRIITTCYFANEVVTTTSTHDAMAYLRSNVASGIFPEMIFLGMNVIRRCGMDFINEFSLFAEKEKPNCGIALMMNVIGLEIPETKRVKTHPHIRFIVEKPLTRESLFQIK